MGKRVYEFSHPALLFLLARCILERGVKKKSKLKHLPRIRPPKRHTLQHVGVRFWIQKIEHGAWQFSIQRINPTRSDLVSQKIGSYNQALSEAKAMIDWLSSRGVKFF